MTKHISFESQLSQLEAIVQSLENGQLPLEDALKEFEQGIKLTRACQKNLQEAQKRMEKLLNTYDIEPQTDEAS